VNGHGRAFGGQFFGDGCADAAAATCDKGYFPTKIHGLSFAFRYFGPLRPPETLTDVTPGDIIPLKALISE
jgi:hypothetical protein